LQRGKRGVQTVRLSRVRKRPIAWLWKGWLASGKFHVLAGPPGVGKSTIALDMLATITVGGAWPEG
jgi:putative DNA primase/helicase